MESLQDLVVKLDEIKKRVDVIEEPSGKLLVIAEEMKLKKKILYN